MPVRRIRLAEKAGVGEDGEFRNIIFSLKNYLVFTLFLNIGNKEDDINMKLIKVLYSVRL